MAPQDGATTDDENSRLVKTRFLAVFSSSEDALVDPTYPDWDSSVPVSDLDSVW